MAVKAVLGILTTLFVIGFIGGGAVLIVWNTSRGRKAQPGIAMVLIGIVAVAILGTLNAGLVLVQPNEVGVVFRQTASGDQALREPLQPGLSWVIPFIDQVIIYDVAQQTVSMSGTSEGETGGRNAVRAITRDGQVIFVDVTVIFRIDRTKINDVHRNWRGEYLDGFVIPQTRSQVRNVMTSYSAEEIYGGERARLEAQVAEALAPKFEEQGFLLTDLLIRDISFSQEFMDAIERRQIAEQEALRAAFRVQQAEQEAEQARVEAQGRADSAVIAAEGEAESIRIRAAAEAEALALINEVLSQNPNLIQWRYINELGDQVRLIIIPSNSPFLFDLQQLMEEAGAQPTTAPLPTPAPQEGETQP